MAKIVPEIAVEDIEKSLAFYEMLGFAKDGTGIVDDQGSQWYSLASGDGALWLIRRDVVFSAPPDSAVGKGLTIYVGVEDVDAVYEQVKASGAPIVHDIETEWYGLRQFTVTDPDGYRITLNMPVAVASEGEGEAAS